MDAVSWIYAAGSLAMLCLGGWFVWAWWTDRMEKAAERKRREDAIAEAAAARHSREERVIRRSREERAIRQAGMCHAPSPILVQRRSTAANRTSTAAITPTPIYDSSSDMMTSMLATQMLTSGQASMPDPEPFHSGGGGDFGGGGASASWDSGGSSSSDSYSSSDSGSGNSSD